ncbi:hypothetical protein [Nocardia sp. X0981]
MSNIYTISISDADREDVLATATVDITSGRARITEIRARAGAEAVPPQLGEIDFSLLVRTAMMFSGAARPGPHPGTEEGPATDDRPSAPAEPAPPMAAEPAPPMAAEPAPSMVAEPVPPTGAPESAVRQSREAARPAPKGNTKNFDMPADFGVTYWRLGSIAKVAKHYDVPHRIAQEWIKALQEAGKAANPWPKKSRRPGR